MSPLLARVLLFALSIAIVVLPLLPAIIELRLKRDATPLNVVQQHGGEIRHFAQGFQKYISCLAGPIERCKISGISAKGIMSDREPYLLVARDDAGAVATGSDLVCRSVVATVADATLPSGMTFTKEVYAVGQLAGGERSAFRAVLGESDVRLAPNTKVTRWLHAAGLLEVEKGSDLYGRVSSDREIRLHADCTFQRLNAPRIRFGDFDEKAQVEGEIRSASVQPRSLVDDDVHIEAGAHVSNNIVTRGKLHIGAGARISGSVKSYGHMHLDDSVHIEGSLVSTSTMTIGKRCKVAGPVISEHELTMERGAQCGTLHHPTTVSALKVNVAEGVIVFGTVWARNEGEVLSQT